MRLGHARRGQHVDSVGVLPGAIVGARGSGGHFWVAQAQDPHERYAHRRRLRGQAHQAIARRVRRERRRLEDAASRAFPRKPECGHRSVRGPPPHVLRVRRGLRRRGQAIGRAGGDTRGRGSRRRVLRILFDDRHAEHGADLRDPTSGHRGHHVHDRQAGEHGGARAGRAAGGPVHRDHHRARRSGARQGFAGGAGGQHFHEPGRHGSGGGRSDVARGGEVLRDAVGRREGLRRQGLQELPSAGDLDIAEGEDGLCEEGRSYRGVQPGAPLPQTRVGHDPRQVRSRCPEPTGHRVLVHGWNVLDFV
mmetsp:Transcript_4906/g.14734  ORF Transcript_4906/g.14734 Transcript_4906/m.14734 type:complete len:306 (+) Transcript_4906:957-1874(+)